MAKKRKTKDIPPVLLQRQISQWQRPGVTEAAKKLTAALNQLDQSAVAAYFEEACRSVGGGTMQLLDRKLQAVVAWSFIVERARVVVYAVRGTRIQVHVCKCGNVVRKKVAQLVESIAELLCRLAGIKLATA